jgi:hypothetical protein
VPTLRIPEHLRPWIEARRRHRLSHAHVQMARELGLNPKKLGKIDNHGQEAWKAPLPDFIERIYSKRFAKARPVTVLSIEDRARVEQEKRAARKEAKRLRRGGQPGLEVDKATIEPPVEAAPALANTAGEDESG